MNQPLMNWSLLLTVAATFLVPLGARAGNKSSAAEQLKKFPTYQRGYLGKEASIKAFEIPEGYKIELVLSEPHIKEPVAVAWDGNGVMYVAEMRTYMQDADASGEQEPQSRISRHEDTDGDGVYDKHSVFIDNILLPRMILPLDDRLMVGVTNTLDLWNYRDTNGDGVADEKVKIYQGGRRGGNMEHQPSGLIWGLDNWIYLTYESIRYRFTDGKLVTEKLPLGAGQWGLTQDDDGRNYYSTAGGENPAFGFQQPIQYGLLKRPDRYPSSFRKIFPSAQVPDVQGGARRVGENGAVNWFTGIAGQEIFRGENLPKDVYGDLFIPEPVGRFIRRAKVTRSNGKSTLSNATPGTEFIRTRDVNFRPVQTSTGPDGCLYIVDMHRGIIQQGNWTRKGSYLRAVIDASGLAENVGHGRIYRLVHKDHQPGKRPNLQKKTTQELASYLSHPNGWWRDTAKKLIILRKDRDTVTPELRKLATDQEQTSQTRITALWTLEGCSAITEPLITHLLSDKNPRIVTHAIRVSEPWIKKESSVVIASINKLCQTDDAEIAIQLFNSLNYCKNPASTTTALNQLLTNHQDTESLQIMLKKHHGDIAEKNLEKERANANAELAGAMKRGKTTFQQICFACHGVDGKGQPLAGQKGHFLAPSFVGSPRVLGPGKAVTLALLHGMKGPIDGKTYDGLMPAQANNSDKWIADVATYIRNSFGNKAPPLFAEQVRGIREEHKKRKTAWTQIELEQLEPIKLNNRKKWKLSATNGAASLKAAIDNNSKSRYSTNAFQKPGMWIQIELPMRYNLRRIDLDSTGSNRDYPRGLKVEISDDGKIWKTVQELTPKDSPITAVHLPEAITQFVRLTQTGKAPNAYWSIHDLDLYGAPAAK